MVSSSLGWAVDTDPNTFHYRLYRYNGAEWVEEKLPARYTRLEGLSMISAFEGYLPYIMRYMSLSIFRKEEFSASPRSRISVLSSRPLAGNGSTGI